MKRTKLILISSIFMIKHHLAYTDDDTIRKTCKANSIKPDSAKREKNMSKNSSNYSTSTNMLSDTSRYKTKPNHNPPYASSHSLQCSSNSSIYSADSTNKTNSIQIELDSTNNSSLNKSDETLMSKTKLSNINTYLDDLPIKKMHEVKKNFLENKKVLKKVNRELESQIKQFFSIITLNMNNLILDITKDIKNAKNDKEIFLLENVKDLLNQLNYIFQKTNQAIELDLPSLKVCYEINLLNEYLKKTKDDFVEELIKAQIKSIWNKFYFKQKKRLNFKKNTLQVNSDPINFDDNILSIISYSETTVEKIQAIKEFYNICKELPETIDSLKNLEFDESLTKRIMNFQSIIKKIQINNSLPNLTNIIVEIFPIINDFLTLHLLGSSIQTEKENNNKQNGFMGFFQKKITAITLLGANSLSKTLMFSLNHSNINYSLYDWYISNYRLPGIINKNSTEKRNNIIAILNLQKNLIMKMIEIFQHNYKSKITLTKQDCNHVQKLLHQLNIISNILTKTDFCSETIYYTQNQIEHMKFSLHSITEDLAYIKRHPIYKPKNSFFENKKLKEIESLDILINEKSINGIQQLCKILNNYFENTKNKTMTNEEDSRDPIDNNLFQIKVNHHNM